MRWLEAPRGPFDVAVVDFPDPNTFAVGKLYTTRFYERLAAALAPDGAIVVQATSPLFTRASPSGASRGRWRPPGSSCGRTARSCRRSATGASCWRSRRRFEPPDRVLEGLRSLDGPSTPRDVRAAARHGPGRRRGQPPRQPGARPLLRGRVEDRGVSPSPREHAPPSEPDAGPGFAPRGPPGRGARGLRVRAPRVRRAARDRGADRRRRPTRAGTACATARPRAPSRSRDDVPVVVVGRRGRRPLRRVEARARGARPTSVLLELEDALGGTAAGGRNAVSALSPGAPTTCRSRRATQRAVGELLDGDGRPPGLRPEGPRARRRGVRSAARRRSASSSADQWYEGLYPKERCPPRTCARWTRSRRGSRPTPRGATTRAGARSRSRSRTARATPTSWRSTASRWRAGSTRRGSRRRALRWYGRVRLPRRLRRARSRARSAWAGLHYFAARIAVPGDDAGAVPHLAGGQRAPRAPPRALGRGRACARASSCSPSSRRPTACACAGSTSRAGRSARSTARARDLRAAAVRRAPRRRAGSTAEDEPAFATRRGSSRT